MFWYALSGIAFLSTEIIVCTTFFSSLWFLGFFISLLFLILCIVIFVHTVRHTKTDKEKINGRCLIVCLLFALNIYTWLNLASRRDVLLPEVRCLSIAEMPVNGYYSITVESQSGEEYRMLCRETALTDIESQDSSASYEVTFRYSYIPPHFGILHSIRGSSSNIH